MQWGVDVSVKQEHRVSVFVEAETESEARHLALKAAEQRSPGSKAVAIMRIVKEP